MPSTDGFVHNASLGIGTCLTDGWPVVGRARELLVLERPMPAELIKLALNRGVCPTRAVSVTSEVKTAIATWQLHLLTLGMDLDGRQPLSFSATRRRRARVWPPPA